MSKIVFITGGTGGLGMAIAKKHLFLGDTVWALDLKSNPDFDLLLEKHKTLKFISCDISKTKYVSDALGSIVHAVSKIDYLYSCAGIYSFDDKNKLPETDLDKAAFMYDVNAVGFLRVTQALLSVIKDGTKIICMTSEAGSISQNTRSAEYNYCMSKAAENMACVILQKHFQELSQNTRVVCIHPGWLRTQMGGPEAMKLTQYSVDPTDSAKSIVEIAIDLDNLPPDEVYMDYKRKLIKW